MVFSDKQKWFCRGVCIFLSSVLPQQKFEVTAGPVLQLSFIYNAEENTFSRCEGESTQKKGREAKARAQFWLPLFMFFLLPLSLPYVKRASQEGCLLRLRSSLRSLDLPFFYFHRLFPSLSFNHLHFGLL